MHIDRQDKPEIKNSAMDIDGIKRYTGSSIRELAVILVTGFLLFIFAARFDILEKIVEFARRHENYEIDEFMTLIAFSFFGVLVFSWRRWRDIRTLSNNLLLRNTELKDALEQIKTLQGILPICSNCKKIRDENNVWHQMESYVSNHTKAQFSHGLCPDCAGRLYPDIYKLKDGS